MPVTCSWHALTNAVCCEMECSITPAARVRLCTAGEPHFTRRKTTFGPHRRAASRASSPALAAVLAQLMPWRQLNYLHIDLPRRRAWGARLDVEVGGVPVDFEAPWSTSPL
jgi:hypothetical protein